MEWIKRNGKRALIVIAVLAAVYLGAQRLRGTEVEVAIVQEGAIEQSIVVSGRVQAPHRVEIGSVITGRVVRVLVEEGAQVEPGQALILLESDELAAARRQAEATLAAAAARDAAVRELNLPQAKDALAQAQAQHAWAESEFKRYRDLREKGFVSESRLQEQQRQLDVATSQVDAARTAVRAQADGGVLAQEAEVKLAEARSARDLATHRLAQTTLRASVPGTVLVRAVEPGDIVSPGKRLLVVNSRGETRLTAQIDEKNLPYLKLDQDARASSEAFPEQNFPARLYYISPGVDVARGSVEARFRVPQPPDYLRADMTVSIDIGVARKDRALTVPLDAVRDSDGGHVAQQVRDGRIAEARVELGIRGSRRVEILSGVKAGDAVVLTRGLADGARVQVQTRQNK